MTTVVQLVSRSLRLLRVLDANEAAEAEDFATAVVALNAMCTRWEANGMALGWADVTAPDEEIPVPPEAEEAVVYNLALRLRAEYGVSLDQDVVSFARQGLAEIRRDRAVEMPLSWRGRRGRYNVYTDAME